MDKPVTEAFIAFVNAQDPNRYVDNSQAWRACAVGEFAQSLGDPIESSQNDTLNALYRENGAFEDADRHGAHQTTHWTMMDMLNHMTYTVSYGELAQYIADGVYE